jgi:hypothetical protein
MHPPAAQIFLGEINADTKEIEAQQLLFSVNSSLMKCKQRFVKYVCGSTA